MSQGRIGAMVTTGGERDVSTRAAGGRVRLGSVWGIPIGLHPSWFFVFALVTWSLAAGYFPQEHPGWPAIRGEEIELEVLRALVGHVLAVDHHADLQIPLGDVQVVEEAGDIRGDGPPALPAAASCLSGSQLQ